jgi:FkbM family methyltransferase
MNFRPPLLLRLLPTGLRMPVFYRFYRNRSAESRALYQDAALHFAPKIRMELLPTDEGHSHIAFAGFYELPLTKMIVALAKDGGLLVDVGANYGYFSLLWAATNPQNTVIAFEASPRNHAALIRNVERNGLAHRIATESKALGRESGVMRFDLGPDEQTGWGGLSPAPFWKGIEVTVTTLDEVFLEREEIAVLKIDVEGADTWVLEGARELLKRRRIAHIMYEENSGKMASLGIEPGTAERILRDSGYEVTPFEDEATAGLTQFHACRPH